MTKKEIIILSVLYSLALSCPMLMILESDQEPSLWLKTYTICVLIVIIASVYLMSKTLSKENNTQTKK